MKCQILLFGKNKKNISKYCPLKILPQSAKHYGNYPKNLNTKTSDKMTYANGVDPDQTAPEGAVWSGSTLFAIPLNI